MEWTAEAPQRLDIYLAQNGVALSRVQAKDVIGRGLVLVNGRMARKAAYMLKPGDKVETSETGEPVTETRLTAVDLQLPVLYEDDDCFVINKPSGIAVHPGAGLPKDEPTILHGVVQLFAERALPFSSAAVLVHRLDKETTGCLLVAKSPEAHKFFQQQFENRTVQKFYLAIVAGIPSPPAALIDAPVGRSAIARTKMSIIGASRSREARTTYRTLSASQDAALLACEMHTGRTHKIRVHLQSLGQPILGYATYGSNASEKLSSTFGADSVCLHAWELNFLAKDGKAIKVKAPPPAAFTKVLERAGLKFNG